MSHQISSFYLGETRIRQHNGLFSLNDLHRAAGGEKKHQPAMFMRREQTQALSAEISSSTDSQSLAFQVVVGKGKAQGTYVCRELVIAYAAWISAAFHLKVIRVFLDAASQEDWPLTTINLSQQQHLKELVDLIAGSGRQTHAETWTRLHRKVNIPRYTELPASKFEEACSYLKGKLDAPAISHLIKKHFPDAVPALPAPAQTPPLKRLLICSTPEGDILRKLSDDDVIVSKSTLDALMGNLEALTSTHAGASRPV